MSALLNPAAGGAFLFGAVCAATPLLAQDISQAPQPTDVTPVVITATRVATPLTDVASSISLITASDLKTFQWRDLPSALRATPGLAVVQTGGPGGLTSVFIRGADSDHTKVVLDGVDVDDPSVGAFDFGQVLTTGIARVEVLRGPASSLYGSDAVGGVINIITERGSGPAHIEATVEGGSFDTVNANARLSGGDSRFDYSLEVANDYSGATPVTPAGLLAPGEALNKDRDENFTAGTKLDYQATPDLSLGLVARFVDADLHYTGEDYSVFPAIPDPNPSDQLTRQLFTRAEARLSSLDGRLEDVFGLGYTLYRTTILSPNDGFGAPPPTIDNGDRIKGDWQGTLKLSPAVTLVGGADADLDRLNDSPINASDTREAAYLEADLTPLRGFDLSASVREDHDQRFGSAATWRIAPVYTIAATGTELKASYGTGFKAPTLSDLYVSFPSFDFFANPNLKPERSQGYDIGFEQPLFGPVLRVGATWFHNVIKDLIDTNADGTSYANIGRATTYGAETFITLNPTSRLSVRADYTYTFTQDDTTGLELLRRPKDVASLTGAWSATSRLKLSATLEYKGGWVDASRDFSVPRLWASPYATVDLAATYRLDDRISLFARIDNLLNRHYQDPIGFERPGIGAFGGVTWSFDAARPGG